MLNRRLLVLLSGGLFGALLALLLPISASAVSPDVLDTAANLPDPVAELQAAQETAPFAIHLPTPLPDGAVPLVVDLVQENSIASFDMWWTLPGSSRLHVWETNNQDLAKEGKDVLSTGTPVQSAGTQWQLTQTAWGQDVVMTELCRKFDDGVTLCVSSDLDPSWLEAVATTIQ